MGDDGQASCTTATSTPSLLQHRCILNNVDGDDVAAPVLLPFIDELQKLAAAPSSSSSSSSSSSADANLVFPLTFDPRTEGKAAVVGMFVLRPAVTPWDTSSSPPTAWADVADDSGGWAFNYTGLDGGWLIGNGSVLDAYRLALQYGCADAVLVSSFTVATEGVDRGPDKPGYVWQPYVVAAWPHLHAACPHARDAIARQREAWQRQGYLSAHRRYPAQIIFTESGEHHEGSADFLEARILAADTRHPTGEPLECYILTGAAGARRVRQRIQDRDAYAHLRDRIDTMLVVLPPAVGAEEAEAGASSVDIGAIPRLLYERLGMRLVNHDGGRQVLRAFARAGALAQVNLTLCRRLSLRQVVDNHRGEPVPLDTFQTHVQTFFGGDGRVPGHWQPVYALTDAAEDVVIVTFDTRKPLVF
jgi:hypothetical protein